MRAPVASLAPIVKRPLLIEELEIRRRAYNVLASDEIVTVPQLCARSQRYLLSLPGMGRISLEEIKEALASKGHWLGQHMPDGRERDWRVDGDPEPWP